MLTASHLSPAAVVFRASMFAGLSATTAAAKAALAAKSALGRVKDWFLGTEDDEGLGERLDYRFETEEVADPSQIPDDEGDQEAQEAQGGIG